MHGKGHTLITLADGEEATAEVLYAREPGRWGWVSEWLPGT